MTAETKLKVNKTKVRQHLLVLFQEYVNEAEHLEGLQYWRDYFETPEEAVIDFVRYLANGKFEQEFRK